MNVKCPYCGCSYNIDVDSFPKPTGDIRLGYGWWLRCCKCQKKWWFKNTFLEMFGNSPLKADVLGKVDRLSNLKKTLKTQPQKKRKYTWLYVLLFLIVSASFICFYYQDSFRTFITQRLEKLSANITARLKMLNVEYYLDQFSSETGTTTITINGNILNEDRNVVKLRGIKVSIYDEQNNEVISWTDKLEREYIMSGETLSFTTKKEINYPQNGQIRVDVSIL